MDSLYGSWIEGFGVYYEVVLVGGFCCGYEGYCESWDGGDLRLVGCLLW